MAVKLTDAQRARRYRRKLRETRQSVEPIPTEMLVTPDMIRRAIAVMERAMSSEHEPTALRAATNFLRILPTTRLAMENAAIQAVLLAETPEVRNRIVNGVRERMGLTAG